MGKGKGKGEEEEEIEEEEEKISWLEERNEGEKGDGKEEKVAGKGAQNL